MAARIARFVVAAVIERGGRILICQRSKRDSHPLKWEFPGGKVEPGERPAEALKRELDEELAIRAKIGPRIATSTYRYPGRPPLRLAFFRVREFEGEPRNMTFEQIRWESPARLPDFDFLEADASIVRALALGGGPEALPSALR
jgi:8-oxo-dGTP diphosphatase